MRYCSNCGSAIPEGANHCPSCGTAVPLAGNYAPAQPAYGVPVQPAGLSINAASALSYLLGLITGIVFLVLEPYKRDRTVRFHAFQSIFLNLAWLVFWIAWGVVSAALSFMTHGFFFLISMLVNMVLGLGFLIVWIVLMVKAAQGQKLVLPVIGPLAEKQAGSGTF